MPTKTNYKRFHEHIILHLHGDHSGFQNNHLFNVIVPPCRKRNEHIYKTETIEQKPRQIPTKAPLECRNVVVHKRQVKGYHHKLNEKRSNHKHLPVFSRIAERMYHTRVGAQVSRFFLCDCALTTQYILIPPVNCRDHPQPGKEPPDACANSSSRNKLWYDIQIVRKITVMSIFQKLWERTAGKCSELFGMLTIRFFRRSNCDIALINLFKSVKLFCCTCYVIQNISCLVSQNLILISIYLKLIVVV